jgi:hypothetical protein
VGLRLGRGCGVRAMAWLTGSVQGTLFGNWLLCLFSCTFPAPLVPRGLESAQLPPTPWVCPNLPFLFSPLRFSSVFSLSLDCLGSRQPGWTQGEGLGSYMLYGPSYPDYSIYPGAQLRLEKSHPRLSESPGWQKERGIYSINSHENLQEIVYPIFLKVMANPAGQLLF